MHSYEMYNIAAAAAAEEGRSNNLDGAKRNNEAHHGRGAEVPRYTQSE